VTGGPAALTAGSAAGRLRVKLRPALPLLHAALGRVWEPSAPGQGAADRYVAYLRVMHQVIRASVPMMELAARRCGAPAAAGPVTEPLRHYLLTHADEERHHDAWLLDDLTAAGADPAQRWLGQVPPTAVAALVGAQYYWIEHFHPVCVLGYIAVLEGAAPAPWLADTLAARTGLPAGAFRTVREHAVLDSGHAAELDALIDRLPLTPAHEAAIAVSALHTVRATALLFDTLSTTSPADDHDPKGNAHGR
jgi:hypothetical protein